MDDLYVYLRARANGGMGPRARPVETRRKGPKPLPQRKTAAWANSELPKAPSSAGN